jgi:hypothetical protein
MTTIVNTPAGSNQGSGSGGLVALVILVLLAVLFLYYGLPALNRGLGTTIQVPGEIDINVNTPNQ